MTSRALSIYLNDHLAASVAALDLLEHLKDLFSAPDAEGKQETVQALTELHREITEDREALREIMRRLEIPEGALRKAAAWAGEKAARVKLHLTGTGKGEAGRLQALEALHLGVTGKTALWRTLSLAEEEGVQPDPARRFQEPDLNFRLSRSREHCARVEALRLEAARRMLREAAEGDLESES